MEQTISQTSQTNGNLGIEELFKAAFSRTKERFLTYFLTYILSILIWIGTFLALGLLTGLNVIIGMTAQSQSLSVSLGLISGVIGLGILIFVGCWTSLAYLYALVSPTKLGVMEVYKSVKPFVWPYFKVSVITTLFMVGILPFGIISLGILLILWALWGMFMIFVFLDKKETGLRNLFISKAIVSSRFWGILLRVLIIYGAYLVIVFLLGAAQGSESGQGLSAILITVGGFFATPFITSYFYELYKKIPHPDNVKPSMAWIIVSVIGWILLIGSIIAFSSAVVQGVQEAIKNNQNLEKNFILDEEGNQLLEPDSEVEMQELERELERLMESSATNEL